MSKYYLLTFDDDWADEHDVPALACMTEEQYSKWLVTKNGDLNTDYEQQKVEWDDLQRRQQEFWKELYARGLYSKQFKNYTPEETLWYNTNKVDYVSHRDAPKKVTNCKMRAYLGNGGDCFDEGYDHMYLMSEFIVNGNVKVMEVDESFYNTFHKANLSSLSLCNVFEIDE